MTGRFAAVVALTMLCAACGPSGGAPGSSAANPFEDGFNKSFAKSAHDSCVKSAVGTGAPAATAESYCACFVDQFAGLSMKEKMVLNPSSPAVTQAAATCKAKVIAPAPAQ